MKKTSTARCTMKASATGSALTIYGEIGQDWFGDGITADQVRDLLTQCNGDLSVYLNSPGGQVFEGLAIYAQIKRYDRGTVTCYVDGLAASIASVIAMAGAKLVMSPASMLMIHEAQGVVMGDAAAMRKCADDLDTVTATIRGVYSAKTGMSDAKVAELMASETWLGAEDCVVQGFADEVLADPEPDADEDDPRRATARVLDTYRNTPTALRQAPQATARAQAQAALARNALALRRPPRTTGTPRPAAAK